MHIRVTEAQLKVREGASIEDMEKESQPVSLRRAGLSQTAASFPEVALKCRRCHASQTHPVAGWEGNSARNRKWRSKKHLMQSFLPTRIRSATFLWTSIYKNQRIFSYKLFNSSKSRQKLSQQQWHVESISFCATPMLIYASTSDSVPHVGTLNYEFSYVMHFCFETNQFGTISVSRDVQSHSDVTVIC